ncbi:MAG: hydroxysqualene dehydroxylase, partial [Solirubrobacteraceae bacterium]
GEAVAGLWDLVVLPTLNLRAGEASLALAAFVFQVGLLNSTDGGDIGFHRGSLSRIVGEPALRTLRESGVDVRLRWRVERVLARRGAEPSARVDELARGVSAAAAAPAAAAGDPDLGGAAAGARAFAVEGFCGGRAQSIAADAVIVALPHLRAAEVLPAQVRGIADRLRSIGVSPIVNLHVLYDRKVCELRFAAGVYSPVQYLFDRSEAGGASGGEQYVAVSLSGADEEMKLSIAELRARYLPALEELLPAARGARVKRFLVTREHAATFRATPGIASLRPQAATGVRGLALAGAHTDTGWPATLEGAARSGQSAAAAVLSDLGAPSRDGAVGVKGQSR